MRSLFFSVSLGSFQLSEMFLSRTIRLRRILQFTASGFLFQTRFVKFRALRSSEQMGFSINTQCKDAETRCFGLTGKSLTLEFQFFFMFWVKTGTTDLLWIYSIAKSIKSNQLLIIFVHSAANTRLRETPQTSPQGALFRKSHYFEFRESIKTSSKMKAALILLSTFKIHPKILYT